MKKSEILHQRQRAEILRDLRELFSTRTRIGSWDGGCDDGFTHIEIEQNPDLAERIRAVLGLELYRAATGTHSSWGGTFGSVGEFFFDPELNALVAVGQLVEYEDGRTDDIQSVIDLGPSW